MFLPLACLADGAPTHQVPAFTLATGSFICRDFGWLLSNSDDDRRNRGHCYEVLLRPDRVVPMDFRSELTLVCLPVRGTLPMHESIICGYTVSTMIKNASGETATGWALEDAARKATMADVRVLP